MTFGALGLSIPTMLVQLTLLLPHLVLVKLLRPMTTLMDKSTMTIGPLEPVMCLRRAEPVSVSPLDARQTMWLESEWFSLFLFPNPRVSMTACLGPPSISR